MGSGRRSTAPRRRGGQPSSRRAAGTGASRSEMPTRSTRPSATASAFDGGDEGSGRADLLHRAGPAEHADPGPEESRPAAVDHRRGPGRPAATSGSSPSPSGSAACRSGCREPGSAASSGTRSSCGPSMRRALGGGARRGRDAVRRGRDRADPRRGRHDRDGLRLRAAPAHAVRPGPGPVRRAARAEHGHGGAREVADDPPNRFRTVRLDGERLPAYGATVARRAGRSAC